MKLKKKTYKAVYVEWIDSTMRSRVWYNLKELIDDSKQTEDKMQTVAYLVAENKLEYVFCASIHFEEGEPVEVGQSFTIPKGCVIKMKPVEILGK